MDSNSKSLLIEIKEKIANTHLSNSEKELLVWTASLLHELDNEKTSKEFYERFILPLAQELNLDDGIAYYLGKKDDSNITQQALNKFKEVLNSSETQAFINTARDNIKHAKQSLIEKINVLKELDGAHLTKTEKQIIEILEKSLTSQPEKWRSSGHTLVHEKEMLMVSNVKDSNNRFRVVYTDESNETKEFMFSSYVFSKIYFGFVNNLKENKQQLKTQQLEKHLVGM